MASAPPTVIPNPLPSLEQRQLGVHDDGTNEGVLRAKIAQGELVKIGVDAIQCVAVAYGSGSVGFNTQNNQYNSDGSSQAVVMNCAAGINQGAYITRKIYGKAVGVRFLRNSTTPSFDVVVDGAAYRVQSPLLQFDGLIPTATQQDGEAYFLIADDLPDGEHTVSVALTPDPAIATTQTLNLFGFLAERRAGYVDRTRVNDIVSNGAVPTTPANIARTNLKNIRAIHYSNTGASTATVTVYYVSAATGNISWQASVIAGATAVLDFGDLTAFSGLHAASASGINYLAYGRN